MTKYFSLDGPMFGANLPIGFQSGLEDAIGTLESTKGRLVANIAGYRPTVNMVLESLSKHIKSPSARQQIISFLPSLLNRYGVQPLFVDFQALLHSNGVDKNGRFKFCESILLNNGSISGVAQENQALCMVGPNQKMIDIHGWVHQPFVNLPTFPVSSSGFLPDFKASLVNQCQQ